ncbi:MAG: nitroreductase family protein [Solirubrobacterales bacterium]|nr:nitroreductase family protein [Solirubrobacterales bacterium]
MTADDAPPRVGRVTADEGHDPIYELMRGTPSTRSFTDRPVPREVLERVLDNARFAPSGGNRQGWRVIVVTDRDKRRRMRELYQEPWERYMRSTGGRDALAAPEASGLPPGRLAMLRGADEYARSFDEVPVHLVVCSLVEDLAITDAELDRPSIVGGASIYPFVHNVLLGLRHEGLGASFTTLLVPAEPALRELLAIPDEAAVAGHISVGYREDRWPRKLSRRPVSEFVFSERFGAPWA